MISFKKVLKAMLPNAAIMTCRYWRDHEVIPNVFWPRAHSEWILYRINFDRRPLLTLLTDKAAVRHFAEERLGPGVLPRLYLLTRDPEEIDFDALPDRFVVKPTHGSGWVRLVANKAKVDRADLIATCRGWLRRNYFTEHLEWSYRDITPRIMIEEFIDDGTGAAPIDYKFFVFHGRVGMIQVDFDRFTYHTRRIFDRGWKKLEMDLGYPDVGHEVKPPPNLAGMIEAAEKFGRGIDFIRVDFYDTGKKFYFGETAVYPGGSWERFYPRDWDYHFGKLWRKPGETFKVKI